jgi:hypothetical protein
VLQWFRERLYLQNGKLVTYTPLNPAGSNTVVD